MRWWRPGRDGTERDLAARPSHRSALAGFKVPARNATGKLLRRKLCAAADARHREWLAQQDAAAQRDILLLAEMIDAAEQAQQLTADMTSASWKPAANVATRC